MAALIDPGVRLFRVGLQPTAALVLATSGVLAHKAARDYGNAIA